MTKYFNLNFDTFNLNFDTLNLNFDTFNLIFYIWLYNIEGVIFYNTNMMTFKNVEFNSRVYKWCQGLYAFYCR